MRVLLVRKAGNAARPVGTGRGGTADIILCLLLPFLGIRGGRAFLSGKLPLLGAAPNKYRHKDGRGGWYFVWKPHRPLKACFARTLSPNKTVTVVAWPSRRSRGLGTSPGVQAGLTHPPLPQVESPPLKGDPS